MPTKTKKKAPPFIKGKGKAGKCPHCGGMGKKMPNGKMKCQECGKSY